LAEEEQRRHRPALVEPEYPKFDIKLALAAPFALTAINAVSQGDDD
jgi:hypothetical protein